MKKNCCHVIVVCRYSMFNYNVIMYSPYFQSWCRVRLLTDDQGNRLKEIKPSQAAKVAGWKDKVARQWIMSCVVIITSHYF